VRSVVIASVVLAINIIITVWATVTGWLNGHAWGSTAVLVLLLVGAAYQLVLRGLEDR
jgi:predicted tellurium resistance membrane protein TerC